MNTPDETPEVDVPVSTPVCDGVGEADIMGRALEVIRRADGCTAHEANARLSALAVAARRDVVVIAAELVYASSKQLPATG